jgi:tRNA 2-thiouridine synthesizing protein C
MTEASHKKILIINRSAPYGNSLARESLDVLLASAAFGQEPGVLFSEDGVWQLVKNQHGEEISQKNLSKSLSALALYDVDDVYVDEASLSARQLSEDDLAIPVIKLNTEAIQELMAKHDVLMSF